MYELEARTRLELAANQRACLCHRRQWSGHVFVECVVDHGQWTRYRRYNGVGTVAHVQDAECREIKPNGFERVTRRQYLEREV